MAATLLIVNGLLPLLPSITTGAAELWKFITTVRTAAQQSNEWTPALETAYQQALLATANDPAYQPDVAQ